MNKKIFNKKSYIYINIVVLFLSIYVIFFPIISNIINKYIPSFGKCAYLTMTGKPCPLCGGTRYIAGIGNVFNDPSYLLNPFGIIIICVIIEIIFRIINLIYLKRGNKLKKIVICDTIIHIILFIAYISYEVIFIMKS